MASASSSSVAADGADRVSYVEAHRRFMALENPSTAVADSNSKAFQDELTRALTYLKRCVSQRQLDGVLSTNERFFELQNTQLYAFCLEYYLGMLTPKQNFFQQAAGPPKQQQQEKPRNGGDSSRSGPTDHTRNVVYRIKFLRDADVFLTEFLDRAESTGILTEKKRREQYERLESKQFTLSRDEKIQRFQMQREMEKKLVEVQRRREERGDKQSGGQKEDDEFDDEDDMDDLEREQLMTFIQLAVIKCVEEQTSINQERDMLETMLKMNTASARQDLFSEAHRPPPPPQGQGIEVTRINPQMEMRRETVRSGVFQPGHRLPTMSLEEYADREVADAMERQKREQEAPQGPRRYEQLVEDGDEDDQALAEEATYKDRAWDDWKDANEKGGEDVVEATAETTEDTVAEGDEEAQAADDLLEEFYSFTYEKAVLVGPTGTSPTKAKAASKGKSGNGSPMREAIGLQKKPTATGPSVASLPTSTGALTREIMDALLPPKTWQDAQGKWQRMVSMLPATRTDAQQLQETFDQLLEQHQARAQAICPVREKFFLQVYEELIREVACECPERGLLLLRMRDELRLTIEAYQTLYHNSIAYGRQKAVQAEGGVGELEGEIHRLEAEREQLIAAKRELTHKVRFLEEQRSEEEKKRELRHAHAVQYLQTQRQELEVFHREMTQDPTWK